MVTLHAKHLLAGAELATVSEASPSIERTVEHAPMTFRRITVGTNAKNQACFSRIEEVAPAYSRPGRVNRRWQIWAEDMLPLQLPMEGRVPNIRAKPTAADTPEVLARSSTLPLRDGVRVAWYEFSPDYKGDKTSPLHWHDSWEIWFIVEGEVVLILDDGSETTLRPGDTAMNFGTNHRWENRSGARVLAALVCLGAVRTGATPPAGDDANARMMADQPVTTST
jgi:mannose-6-phosphate isomerase-like protein (cupin superfamily)